MPSLQAKMFVVFALIATLPLTALSYLALAEARDALEAEVGRAHAEAARAAAAYVEGHVASWSRVVERDARDEDLVAALRAGDADAAARELDALARRGADGALPLYAEARLWDAEGTLVASIGNASAALPASVLDAARTGKAALVPEPGRVVLAAPVGDDAFAGVLATPLALDALERGLRAFGMGESQGVVLLDASGAVLVGGGGDWLNVEAARRALAGGSGHLVFEDPESGAPVLGGYAGVPAFGWGVVEREPAAAAYAGLARLTGVLIVLSAILVGGVLLASVVLARRIVAPVRQLTAVAGDIASGRLRARADARGDDEIAELARTFNTMADRIGESLDGLRRSEARYRNLVESANDVVWTIEPSGELSFVGPQAERLLGRDAASLVGGPYTALVHEGDAPRFREALDGVLRGAAVAYLPHLVVAGDGARRPFRSNLSPVFGPDGKVTRALVVSRDVTTEERQERLREQSFMMARLVSGEASLDRLAREGLAIALAAAGATRGAAYIRAGDELRLAFHAGAEDASLAAEAARAGRSVERDGLLAVPLVERGEALGALVVERSGAVDREALVALASQLAVGLRRSLFEQRLREHATELEARVAARTAELQEKNEEIESFLYSVSHDLKAPLISIEGYAEGLEEDYAGVLDEEGRQYLDRIRKNATLMETLILDLLELSRIGRVRSPVESVDARGVALDVAARLEDRFSALGGSLRVADDLPRVRGERNRIEQLFGNLLENALKYRHPDRPPRVEVSAARHAEGVEIRVADNGRGIPPAQRDALFRIFHRLPAPRGMPDPGGTGMGLAIVKRIVDTHGGRVWVESQEGEGTTFHVLLPPAEAER